MVKIEIRIQGNVRDNIVCKWVTEEQLSFLRTLKMITGRSKENVQILK